VDINELAFRHGTTRDDMLIKEADVYARGADDPTGDIVTLGLTDAEKTLTLNMEMVEWKRGVPAATYVADVSGIAPTFEFTFKQFDPVNVALWLNGEIDRTDPNTDVVTLGSEPNAPAEMSWWWISELRDGRPIQWCFRRGVILNPGTLTTGTGEYTGMPVTVSAWPEEDICDKTGDLLYVCIGKLAVPSGGFIDPCAAPVTPCEID